MMQLKRFSPSNHFLWLLVQVCARERIEIETAFTAHNIKKRERKDEMNWNLFFELGREALKNFSASFRLEGEMS
jgi:hypothetical protein